MIYARLIGRDIPLHALGAILTTFGVRRVEASRSGRGATGGAGAGSAASIVRTLAALNSLQIAHAACVFSGSEECSERWRAKVRSPVQNSTACSRQTGEGFAGMSMTAHSSQYVQYAMTKTISGCVARALYCSEHRFAAAARNVAAQENPS